MATQDIGQGNHHLPRAGLWSSRWPEHCRPIRNTPSTSAKTDMQTNYTITLRRSCLAMPVLANRFKIQNFALAKCCQSVDGADHCVAENTFSDVFFVQ
jgi:hypothetical protein